MKNFRTWAASALAVALLVACGGGDPDVPGSGSPSGAPTTPGSFTAVVSFGDSLSDLGTYTVATSANGDGSEPYLGGKFTTNTADAKIWVENVAAALGLVVTQAEAGFGDTTVVCPVQYSNPDLASTCTGYAQGGARVTDPNGVRHLDPATGALRALTVPLKTQIANHLARVGNFKDTDLILIQAGGNDLIWEMETDPRVNVNSYLIKLAQIQQQAQAGQITLDQARGLAFQAQLASQAAMKAAALELAGYIRDEILAKGGKYVVVMGLPDVANTPLGAETLAQSEVAYAALSTFSKTFNLWLRDGLAGQPVKLIDLEAFFNAVIADPAAFNIVNASSRTCDVAKMNALTGGAVSDGFSLFCNATVGSPLNGIADGADPATWFFADGLHPTTGGYKVFSDEVLRQLRAAGWIN